MLTLNFHFKYLPHLLRLKLVGNKAKVRISERVLQQKKTRQIFRKTNISYPLIRTRTCALTGGKKCSSFQKFGMLCFLVTPLLRFVLLPYYRRKILFWYYSQNKTLKKQYNNFENNRNNKHI